MSFLTPNGRSKDVQDGTERHIYGELKYESEGGFGLAALNMGLGMAARSQAGISIVEGQYPEPWAPVQMTEIPFVSLVEEAAKALLEPTKEEKPKPIPLTLPPWFGEDT